MKEVVVVVVGKCVHNISGTLCWRAGYSSLQHPGTLSSTLRHPGVEVTVVWHLHGETAPRHTILDFTSPWYRGHSRLVPTGGPRWRNSHQ